jgi:antitoxin (DNA-binding transcriptional repressor) of toxin-antitoxin stability system
MEKASVSKLKDHLSAYLRKVRAGHSVVIYDRDVPIARLERIESGGAGADRLALLYAQGLTRPPSRPLTPARLRTLLSKAAPRSARLTEAAEATALRQSMGYDPSDVVITVGLQNMDGQLVH